MWYVYILKSKKDKNIYIGSTNDLKRRYLEHNNACNKSTKTRCPWELIAYIAVRTEQVARNLEKYFKTGSGKALLKKRILTDLQMLTDK